MATIMNEAEQKYLDEWHSSKDFYSVYEPNYVICGDWEKMFAWKPVKTINGERVWMKTVYKRSVVSHQGMIYGDDYATLLDILGEQQ